MNGVGYYLSPIGGLIVRSSDEKITSVNFCEGERSEETITPVITQCIEQLNEYFLDGRKFFTVDMELAGTSFQKRVWTELLAIPYGKTISYMDLALRLGDINSIRAVGLANGQNPVAVIVPCHRVIGKNGDLVGYAGGLDKKVWLLEHEGAFSEQLRLWS